MTFWDGMELWEKMLLLLAGGMVCVLFAGVSKMVYTKLRVQKFAKKAEARRSHLENMRESRHVINLKSDEVPFGIRAIEAGIEVEGVVISRPPTPTRASYNPSQVTLVASDADSMKSRGQCPPSPRSAQGFYGTPPPMKQMARGGPMVYQPSPYLSMPSPVHQGHSGASSIRSSASSVASTATPTPPLTRVSSSEKLGRGSFPEGADGGYYDGGRSTPTKATTIPDTLAKLEGRTTSPALEHRKSTGSRHYRTHSRTPSPPEGPGSPTLPSVDENEISEGSSRASDSSVEGMAGATRPRLVSAYSTPVLPTMHRVSQPLPEGVQGDLSLLHEHRLSHAAEVGQLLPRRRDTLRNSQIAGSPVAESPSYHSPTTSDRVYALDIAMPPAMQGVNGLQFPAPAVTAGSPPRLELTRRSSDPESGASDRPMFDGPWLSKSGGNDDKDGSASPRTADQSDSTTPKSKVPADFSSDSEPPKQKSKKLQKKNRKSRGSPSRSSAMDVDLEAQR